MDNIYFSRLTQKDITKKYGHPIDLEFNPQGEFEVVEGMAEKLIVYLKENPY
ncbi:hypothetical protein [Flexithrix dorotheae]|uniref:hypothetical protein n=1 Tax=Flexithrix dorotheae TaxID=70993 RepID=UPI000378D773|nr:hypothetical protein [Flexithrix dorotheae]